MKSEIDSWPASFLSCSSPDSNVYLRRLRWTKHPPVRTITRRPQHEGRVLYMHFLLHHHPLLLRTPCSSSFPSSRLAGLSFSTMSSSSLALPSISLQKLPSSNASNSFRSSNSSLWFRNVTLHRNLDRSRVSMNVSVGSRAVVDDALFSDYKPSCAFLFPGQVVWRFVFLLLFIGIEHSSTISL